MKKYRKQILICAGLVTLTNVAAQQQQKRLRLTMLRQYIHWEVFL